MRQSNGERAIRRAGRAPPAERSGTVAVQVIVHDGSVTVVGTVVSEAERRRVLDAVAREIAGREIDDQLAVDPGAGSTRGAAREASP
jgi:osmotically-inducible protein OsmY